MTLLWPGALFAFGAIPVALAVYVARVRRSGDRPELAAFRASDPKGRRRRHIVFALFLLAAAVMIAAVTRPELNVGTPRFEGTVILAIDTSSSMRADDMDPTRLAAAQQAARDFVDAQPDNIDVGLVTFSNSGALIEPPTDERETVLAAIDRLEADGPTSLAQAVYAALETIVGEPLVDEETDPEAPIDTAEFGFHGSSIVLVLSDGEDTPDVAETPEGGSSATRMAETASALGVEIFAVGFGTEAGAVIEVEGFSLATSLIEESLIELTDTTGGEYRRATTDADIADLYDRVDTQFTTEGEPTEVTAHVALAGALLLIIAALLSMRWFGRVP